MSRHDDWERQHFHPLFGGRFLDQLGRPTLLAHAQVERYTTSYVPPLSIHSNNHYPVLDVRDVQHIQLSFPFVGHTKILCPACCSHVVNHCGIETQRVLNLLHLVRPCVSQLAWGSL